jgi:hypothetical protein
MLGYAPNCVFMVFANPPAGRATELQEWYDVIHGPDAIENGSFNFLSRWQCISRPGAPFLALWEAEWSSDAHAWGYIRPRAIQLNTEGRIGDIPSAEWAQMMFAAPNHAETTEQPTRTLTMVQSDWYHAPKDQPLEVWAAAHGLDRREAGGGTWHSRTLYSADPAVEPGLHVAFFESIDWLGAIAAGWSGIGSSGPSPTRPFKGLFEERGQGNPVPEPTACYVSHWVQIGCLGDATARGRVGLG